MRHWELTDTGKVRKENQDSFSAFTYTPIQEEGILTAALVCDGMGGAKGGAVAGRLAAETVEHCLMEQKPGMREVRDTLKQAVDRANQTVFEKSMTDSECSGMGTTLVAAVSDGRHALVANVGDSRCYLICDKNIVQITKDHSLVENLVESGEISRAEARVHPQRNIITRAIGVCENIKVDFFEVELPEDSFLLLCSDGLSGIVGDQELLFEIVHMEKIEKAVERMVDIALERGAPDNVTAVLLTNRAVSD